MDNINKILTVLCVLIMSFMVGGSAEHCGGLNGCVNDPGSIISKDTFNNMLKRRNDGACPASTPMKLSFRPPSLSRLSPAPAMPLRARGSSRLSSAKLPTRPPVVGPPLLTVLTLGVTASKRKRTPKVVSVNPAPKIHVLRARDTMAADQSNILISLCFTHKKVLKDVFVLSKRNFNNGPCGRAVGVDLLRNPDLVATNPVISFKTALWFWMTPQRPKPSCHDVNYSHICIKVPLLLLFDNKRVLII